MGEPGDVAQAGHRHVEHLRGIQIVFDNQDAKVVREPRPPAVRPRRLSASCAALIGRRISTSVPWPGPGLRISIRPSCISTRRRASVSPMPRPPADRSRVGSACWNISNTRGRASGAIPIPVSRMRTTASSACWSAVNQICPPRGVNFTALLRIFAKICTSRVPSP